MPSKSKLKRVTSRQSSRRAFIIPYTNSMESASRKNWYDWNIWTYTYLDLLILNGLPVKASVGRPYHCADLEEGQSLLAECYVNLDE